MLVTDYLFGGEGREKEWNWSWGNLCAVGKHGSLWREDNGHMEHDGDEDDDNILPGKMKQIMHLQ